jgi:hypothetical protein
MNELLERCRLWVNDYSWAFYAVLNAPSGPVSLARANRMFCRWVAELRDAEGSSQFRWIRFSESGYLDANLRFHTILGGLRDRKTYWADRWRELGARATIRPFDDGKKFLAALATVVESGDPKIEFESPRPRLAWTELDPKNRGGNPESLVKIVIDNLDDRVSPSDIKKLLNGVGVVTEITLIVKRRATQS